MEEALCVWKNINDMVLLTNQGYGFKQHNDVWKWPSYTTMYKLEIDGDGSFSYGYGMAQLINVKKFVCHSAWDFSCERVLVQFKLGRVPPDLIKIRISCLDIFVVPPSPYS